MENEECGKLGAKNAGNKYGEKNDEWVYVA
jgi:hypothetical protein